MKLLHLLDRAVALASNGKLQESTPSHGSQRSHKFNYSITGIARVKSWSQALPCHSPAFSHYPAARCKTTTQMCRIIAAIVLVAPSDVSLRDPRHIQSCHAVWTIIYHSASAPILLDFTTSSRQVDTGPGWYKLSGHCIRVIQWGQNMRSLFNASAATMAFGRWFYSCKYFDEYDWQKILNDTTRQ